MTNISLSRKIGGPLSIVRMPTKGRNYTIGVDSSEGVRGGDPSAIVVLDIDDMEQVAWFRGWIHPKILARKASALGFYYNTAYLVVEANSYGHAVVWELMDEAYPRLYRHIITTDVRRGVTFKPGFWTDSATRPKLWAKGRHVVNEGYGRINSTEQLKEMMSIRYPDEATRGEPIPEHPKGRHDDLTVAWLLAVWGRDTVYERGEVDAKVHVPSSLDEKFSASLKIDTPDEDDVDPYEEG